MPAPAVALLYPGDRSMRDRADPAESRFATLFEAFARAGVTAVPAVYDDAFADEVEAQLRAAVWCSSGAIPSKADDGATPWMRCCGALQTLVSSSARIPTRS